MLAFRSVVSVLLRALGDFVIVALMSGLLHRQHRPLGVGEDRNIRSPLAAEDGHEVQHRPLGSVRIATPSGTAAPGSGFDRAAPALGPAGEDLDSMLPICP
jgi:hypothetical protein